jgi:hypothetical protein
VACVLPAAFFYWSRIGAHPVRCVLGDAACSLTVATYVLASLTLAVFWATSQAAIAAWHAFTHEQRVAVALQRCNNDRVGPKYVLRRRSSTGSPVPPPHVFDAHRPSGGVIQAYLRSGAEDFQATPPANFPDVIAGSDRMTYQRFDFDVLSAGRSPLVHGVLSVCSSATGKNYSLPIGSVAAGEQVHLVLWLSDEVRLSTTLSWVAKASHSDGDEVHFFPPPQLEINPTFDVPIDSIPGEVQTVVPVPSTSPPPGVT